MKNSVNDKTITHYKLNRASIPIQSKDTEIFIKNHLEIFYKLSKKIDQKDYETSWKKFLTSNTNNKIDGLEEFKYSGFCHGTSQAITEFVARNNKRRLRVSRIDFVLSKIVGKAYHLDVVFLEDGKLEKNDCVVISFPFSGNGSYFLNYEELLSTADRLDVPVLIDGAYFGIGNQIKFPLHHKSITDFTTSLSKSHGVADYRIGIRFKKIFVDDHISATKESGIFNKFNAVLAINLMEKFNHNYIVKKYSTQQKNICDDLKLNITNTLTFGLGNVEQWPEYARGNNARICISENFS